MAFPARWWPDCTGMASWIGPSSLPTQFDGQPLIGLVHLFPDGSLDTNFVADLPLQGLEAKSILKTSQGDPLVGAV